jgi:DNA-binding beta-propeller fold protein YncE
VYFDAIDGIRRLRGSASTVVVPFSSSRSPRSVAVDSTRRKLFVALESSERADVQRYDLAGATPVHELTLGNVTPLVGGYYAPDPGQLAVAPNGALVITYPETHVVRRIDPGFSRVDTIAGAQEAVGVELGPLPARLNNPTGVAFNASGQFAIIMGQAGTTNRGFGEGALLVTTGFTP